jgi:hypothetical protein
MKDKLFKKKQVNQAFRCDGDEDDSLSYSQMELMLHASREDISNTDLTNGSSGHHFRVSNKGFSS